MRSESRPERATESIPVCSRRSSLQIVAMVARQVKKQSITRCTLHIRPPFQGGGFLGPYPGLKPGLKPWANLLDHFMVRGSRAKVLGCSVRPFHGQRSQCTSPGLFRRTVHDREQSTDCGSLPTNIKPTTYNL